MRLHRLAVAPPTLVLVVSLACSAPQVEERGAAACANGLDDDRDGDVDCKDRDCVAAESCERTQDTCRDGVDNDRSGILDCEEPACQTGGFCEPFVQECEPIAQRGCPGGMACYVVPFRNEPTRCARDVGAEEYERCAVDVDAFNLGCRGRFTCVGSDEASSCYKTCGTDDDCPRETFCFASEDGTVGYCSQRCVPNGLNLCTNGLECIPMQQLGFERWEIGSMHTCWPAFAVRRGSAEEGAACLTRVTSTAALDRVCAPGLVCVPEPAGSVCRRVCTTFLDGPGDEECGSARCVPFVPFDQRPAHPAAAGEFLGSCTP